MQKRLKNTDLVYQPCNTAFSTIINSQWKEKVIKNKKNVFTDECMPMHTQPHDEIINFTGVERTNTEIDVRLFDNANVYMT